MDLLDIRNKLNMGYNLNDLNLRVTYYSRVSTDHLEQKNSLINQNEHFEEYIKENKNWFYVTGYVDDGITGTSDIKREEFMQMIDDAKNDKFDLIITKEISRFSRNTLDSIKYTRMLLSYGVAVFFQNDNINTIYPDSELRLTIMASMAQDEIRRLSERVKFGMHHSQQKGNILGNDMLYGYKKDKTTGNLKIIEDEAQVIRNIYNMYIFDNFSLNKISKVLNEQNIYTRQNKLWSATNISRMLKNPKYKGYYCAKKVETIDYMNKKVRYINEKDWIIYKDNIKVPPIITEEIWAKANDKTLSKTSKRTKNIDKNIYNNKIYCKKDNYVFYKRYFRRNKKDLTWVCSNYLNKGKDSCSLNNIREVELDKITDDIIDKLKLDKNKIIKLLTKIYNSNENTATLLINKKQDIILKKNKLIELNINNIIDLNTLKERINILNKEEKKITKEINALKGDKNKINIKKLLEQEINTKEFNNKLKELLIDKIVVSKIKENMSLLEIYLNSNYSFKNKYIFKRGYDVSSTKRYFMTYFVSIIKNIKSM